MFNVLSRYMFEISVTLLIIMNLISANVEILDDFSELNASIRISIWSKIDFAKL